MELLPCPPAYPASMVWVKDKLRWAIMCVTNTSLCLIASRGELHHPINQI